jgi:hypothetical protein
MANVTSEISDWACDLHLHYPTLVLLVALVLSWVTRELLVYLLTAAIQFVNLLCWALTEYTGRCSTDRFCRPADSSCFSWPSVELAQLALFLTTAIAYNSVWHQWHNGLITKAVGVGALGAVTFLIMTLRMVTPGAAVLGLLIGVLAGTWTIAVARLYVFRAPDNSVYNETLLCTRCVDNLIGRRGPPSLL